MQKSRANRRRAGALALTVAAGAAALASTGAAASEDGAAAAKAGAATITATLNGKNLEFQGDRTVKAGSPLKVVNATDPKQVGPHTFTLVKRKNLPTTKSEMKECGRLQSKVCADVAKAHEVGKTGKVGKPVVDAAKTGWDKSFGRRGDSWVSHGEGETEQRKVVAKPGTTLTYFCVVHPFMHGKIKVVK